MTRHPVVTAAKGLLPANQRISSLQRKMGSLISQAPLFVFGSY